MPIASDITYTLKLLKKNAGFSLLCIVLIGLGIMASLAMFSILWNFSLKTPGIAQADRFVTLTLITPRNPSEVTNYFRNDWYEFARERAESFEVFGATRTRVSFNINDGDSALVVSAATIDPALLEAAAPPPLLGRNLRPEDDGAGAEPVALLGYELWQSHYAGDPDIVGRRSRIGGVPRTIVGVMPPGFGFPFNSDMWLPLQLRSSLEPAPGNPNLTLLGVLRESVSLAAANAEIGAIAAAFNDEMADVLPQPLFAFVRPFSHLLALPPVVGAVLHVLTFAILLLVAFNLGNLLLYRANERAHELAVRSAVGARRLHVMRALLLEPFLLCALGALLGLLLGAFALDYIDAAMRTALAGDSMPFWMHFGLDRAFIAFTLICTLLIWLLSGALPALRLFSQDITAALGGGSRGLARKGSLRLTRAFVCLEVVVSCFLLMIALAAAVVTARDVRSEFGVATENRYAGTVRIDRAGTSLMADAASYARALQVEQLSRPGIDDATYASIAPGHGGLQQFYNLEDREPAEEGVYPMLHVVGVADNYFAMLEVEVLEGRFFNAGDTADSQPVGIIDRRLAEALWPGESALGKRIQLDPARQGPWLDIVGVVATVYQEYLPLEGRPAIMSIYRPFAQTNPPDFLSLIRTTLPERDAYARMRDTVARTSPDLAVHRLNTLQNHMLIIPRPFLLLRDIFSGVAVVVLVLIASVVYGLVSRSYMNRADEIGLRRALGASDRQAMMVFIREALWLLVLGLGIGGLGGVLLSGALTSFLPNIVRYLPAVALATLFFIAAVVLAASYFPAAKSVAMEPGDALRHE